MKIYLRAISEKQDRRLLFLLTAFISDNVHLLGTGLLDSDIELFNILAEGLLDE